MPISLNLNEIVEDILTAVFSTTTITSNNRMNEIDWSALVRNVSGIYVR